MPTRIPAKSETTVCVECAERDATLDIRNRRLCATCFSRYVNSKVLKRMESYRFKARSEDEKDRLLLPISGGVSSLVLLQVLDTQLQKQLAKRNRTAYDLVIVRVILPEEEASTSLDQCYEELKQRFSSHTFLQPPKLQEVFETDDRIERDLEHLGIKRQAGESSQTLLQRITTLATSVTARADLQSILLQRLIVSVAQQQTCAGIVWGHSDSRLAALVLADVAKGRGGSVSSIIADGPSVYGITFIYPMRDLFKTELEAYARVASEPLLAKTAELDGTPSPQPSSVRHTSIDSLLKTYIDSQGEKYPGIMANVVRTASKLQGRQASAIEGACPVCVRPIVRSEGLAISDSILCYGCDRMKHDIRS
ncbi:Cytoplasmic tRNA 2-thiolation protein 2 [Exophiala dermatitidis]